MVLGARRTDRLDVTGRADSAPPAAAPTAVTVDVTRAEDLHRLTETAVSTYGRLDVLVSSAGIGPDLPDDRPPHAPTGTR